MNTKTCCFFPQSIVIIGLCLVLIGCARASCQIEKPFLEPQFGMTKLQMFDLLGKPESVEIYKKSNQTRVEFYIYVRKYRSYSQKVPVCLIDNKIAGWGKAYYEDHISQDDIRIR